MTAGKNARKVFVAGVNGFLGRALWQYFKRREKDFYVYGLARKPVQNEPDIFVCDLLGQKRRLKSILSSIRPEFIFHLAGRRMGNKNELFKSNYTSTKCLLDAIRNIKNFRPRVIIPGSAAEYGPMPMGRRRIKETDVLKPQTPYGKVKLQQTHLALRYAREGGDVVIARIFNAVGEGTPPDLAIGRFAEQIAMIEQGLKEKVLDTRNLQSKRDFLDIDDICAALWAVARHGRSGEIYNVCSGRPLEIRKVLRKLLSVSKEKNIKIVERKDSSSPSFDVIGSHAKLISISGWAPRINLDRSLNNTLRGYRNGSIPRKSDANTDRP